MHGAKLFAFAVGTVLGIGSAAPSAADEFTDSLASLRRAMAGHWSGAVAGTDASGETFETRDDFTFAVTSEDGLDSATWSADTLEIATQVGDGLYRVRNWNRTGRQGGVEYRVRILEGPDAEGNGTWVLELEQTRSDGVVMELREYFTLNDDSLRMEIEMRPSGSDGPFETTVTGTWSRVTN